MKRRSDPPWRRLEELFEPFEGPCPVPTVRQSLELVAVNLAVFSPVGASVCVLLVLLFRPTLSELVAVAEVFFGMFVASLALYVVAVLFGRLEQRPSPRRASSGERSPVPPGRTRAVTGIQDVHPQDQWRTARAYTAGFFAVQGTPLPFAALHVWPLWASVAAGASFLLLAYLVHPSRKGPPETGRTSVPSVEATNEEATSTPPIHRSDLCRKETPRAEGQAVARSGAGEHVSRSVSFVLFAVLFHAGLFANVGVVVALAGGPLWAFLGGFLGPPLIVGSFFVGPTD